jgi:signal peptide peptidase SppA
MYELIKPYLSTPWAIAIAFLDNLVRMGSSEVGKNLAEVAQSTQEKNLAGVAYLKLHGVIVPDVPDYYENYGYVNPKKFISKVKAAADHKDVKETVISVHSPGGVALLIDEMSDAVAYHASIKPIRAVVNGYGASAGYWSISQATEIIATRLSAVGSVGVITGHADWSKLYEKEGVDVKWYRTGEEKALGQRTDPNDKLMSDVTMAELNAILAVFAGDIAKGRRMSLETILDRYALDSDHPDALRGNTALGAEAVRLGLADRVATVEEVMLEAVQRVSKTANTKQFAVLPFKRKETMNEHELLALLQNEEVTEEQIRAAITKLQNHSTQTETARIAGILGIEMNDSNLARIKAEAADGKKYREALLERLAKAVTTNSGEGAKAEGQVERYKRLYKNAEIADLEAEVEAQEAKTQTLVPDTRKSVDGKTDAETVDVKHV